MIIVDKQLGEFDHLVLDFIRELSVHQKGLLTGKYLTRLLGVPEMVDEVEFIIPRIYRKDFAVMYEALEAGKFWCITSADVDELFARMVHQVPLRFAQKYETSPVMKLRFPYNKYEGTLIKHAQVIKVHDRTIQTVPLAYYLAFQSFCEPTEDDAEGTALLKAKYANKVLLDDITTHKENYEKLTSPTRQMQP